MTASEGKMSLLARFQEHKGFFSTARERAHARKPLWERVPARELSSRSLVKIKIK
jgi:hypothetical protein